MNPPQSATIHRNAKKHEADIRRLIEEGLSAGQISREMGVSYSSVNRWLEALEIPPPGRQAREVADGHHERLEAMVAMRVEGKSLKEIGDRYGVSRERIRQILQKGTPDIILQPRRATVRICNGCGREFNPTLRNQNSCSLTCNGMKRSSGFWCRDNAEAILALRKQGCNWDEIARRLAPLKSGMVFRSNLQKWITILYTTAEREEFFPPKGTPHYKP